MNEIGQVLQFVPGVREWLSHILPAELLGWLAGNEWTLWVAAALIAVATVTTLASAFGD